MYRTLSPGAIDVHVDFTEAARLAERYGFSGLARLGWVQLELSQQLYDVVQADLVATTFDR